MLCYNKNILKSASTDLFYEKFVLFLLIRSKSVMGKLLELLFYIILIPIVIFIELIKLFLKFLKNLFNKTSVNKKESEHEEKMKSKIIVKKDQNYIKKENVNKVLTENNVSKVKYKLPAISLLDNSKNIDFDTSENEIKEKVNYINDLLSAFKINVKVTHVRIGPRFTNYEIILPMGMKIDKIKDIKKEIALALAAKNVEIIPSFKNKNSIYIEVENKKVELVKLKTLLLNTFDKNKNDDGLLIYLGINNLGESVIIDICKMPNLIISGTTGSGVSICLNGIILSLLMKYKPDYVRFIMIDTKKVEFSMYNGIPHLLTPVLTDPKKASIILKKVVQEMKYRYDLLNEAKTKNIESYNKMIQRKIDEGDVSLKPLPYIVILIDELDDLMLISDKEVLDSIDRITQLARAAGIHLIIATQLFSGNILTKNVIKNISARIALTVNSSLESKIILGENGAEDLKGNGDMLFKPRISKTPIRIQGVFVTENEIKKVVNYVAKEQKALYDYKLTNLTSNESSYNPNYDQYDDPLYNEVVDYVIKSGKTSASLLQRRFRLGYNRTSRIIDLLEERGIVGPPNGSKPRDVLVKYDNEDY